jgi:hypothetical protein
MFHFDSSESRDNAALLRGSCQVRNALGYGPCTRTAQPDQTRTNRGVGAVAVRAEIARLDRKKNRTLRIRRKQKIVTKKLFATCRSCRSLVPAIGDQISFPNASLRLPRGKASTDERHQTFE